MAKRVIKIHPAINRDTPSLMEQHELLKLAEECTELSFELIKRANEGGRIGRIQQEAADVRKRMKQLEVFWEDPKQRKKAK